MKIDDILKQTRIMAVNKIADKTDLNGFLGPNYKISVDRKNGNLRENETGNETIFRDVSLLWFFHNLLCDSHTADVL